MNLDNLTPDRQTFVERVKSLYLEGASYNWIAEQMCCSRNVVAGLVRRLKLPKRRSTDPTKSKKPKQPKPEKVLVFKLPTLKATPYVPRPAPVDIPRPVPLMVSALDVRDDQCKYAVASDPTLFCGAPSKGSWCPYHRRLVFYREA